MGCETGAAGAGAGAGAGVAGATAGLLRAPSIEIFGGVTGFGVGGVPPFGAATIGEALCGLF